MPIIADLRANPKTWLITGVAGFIGSNLLEELLRLNQRVIGIDNFATGFQRNLDEVRASVSTEQWSSFRMVDGDICDYECCREILLGDLVVDYVLHQAALGSVPRSIEDPISTNNSNVVGFLNILTAAKQANIKSFTYAASSSTYGDHPDLPKVEHKIGNPLSPYAVSKLTNELYAKVFAEVYGFKSVGLRYFNVFGKRQDPHGAYAAVILKWTALMLENEDCYINGDGENSRDFCFIENIIQMNILAATAPETEKDEVYNVALGNRTTLVELFNLIKKAILKSDVFVTSKPVFREFRAGDVRHSQADISKAVARLGYQPRFDVRKGIEKTMPWYIANIAASENDNKKKED